MVKWFNRVFFGMIFVAVFYNCWKAVEDTRPFFKRQWDRFKETKAVTSVVDGAKKVYTFKRKENAG